MKKKILLTGGNGFIGKNIKESFLAEKYDIISPRSFELNLIDTDCVDNFFKDKEFDVVLHAAVKPGHRNSKDTSSLFYSNIRMFENLERHKDKFKKFINFGSGAIYDTSKNITDVKEEDIYKNIGLAEHDFCKYVIQKQIDKLDDFVNLHIFGIFGKYEDWEIRFISNAICKAIMGLPITLRQNRKFSYLYVDDLMPILDYFIENKMKYKSYNIVPDEKCELLTLAERIKFITGSKSQIIVGTKGYGYDYTGNNERLLSQIVNISFTKIDEAITKLYNYYMENSKLINKDLLLHDK